MFRGIAVEILEPIYLFPAFNGIGEEFVFLQNLPSVIAGHVLDPQKGDIILDMCSAPGTIQFLHIKVIKNVTRVMRCP